MSVIKIFGALLVLVFVLVFAGISGVTFYLWPTYLSDQRLNVTSQMLQQLADVKQERKFLLDKQTFYPGAPNEVLRAEAQLAVDTAILSLINDLPGNPQRSFVLQTFKMTLANFKTPESEERDQLLHYLSRVMEICGVTSSFELMNVWCYGFPYGWFV